MEKKLVGKKCPKFSGDCSGDIKLSNTDFIGKNVVVYFYPKDSTPGCTIEGQDFRDNFKKFKKLNSEILGVSRDSFKSMYGKQYIGVDRSTFLINEKGVIVKEWRSVKVKGHVEEVLAAVQEL